MSWPGCRFSRPDASPRCVTPCTVTCCPQQYVTSPCLRPTVTDAAAHVLLQFAAQQNKTAQLRSAIKSHRDTWVNESDFAFMASIGVNCVRLPVGYWVLAQAQVRWQSLFPYT